MRLNPFLLASGLRRSWRAVLTSLTRANDSEYKEESSHFFIKTTDVQKLMQGQNISTSRSSGPGKVFIVGNPRPSADEYPDDWLGDMLAMAKADKVDELFERLHILLPKENSQSSVSEAIYICQELLSLIEETENPRLLASIQNSYGALLSRLGELTENAALIEEGIEVLLQALKWRQEKEHFNDWAMTQTNLASSVFNLGKLTGDASRLRESASILENLTNMRPVQNPLPEWFVSAQIGLAIIQKELGSASDEISYYQAAEKTLTGVLSNENISMPLHLLVAVHVNTGNIMQDQGVLLGSDSKLREAEASFRVALQLVEELQDSGLLSLIQMNLGNTLTIRGERANDVFPLREAEKLLREVVLRSKEVNPDVSGKAQRALGNTLREIGELTRNSDKLTEAVHVLRDRLSEMRPDVAPDEWASTNSDLGLALGQLGQLMKDEEALELAERYTMEALARTDREQSPAAWAGRHDNLGNIYSSQFTISGLSNHLDKAEAAFRTALSERRSERLSSVRISGAKNLSLVLLKQKRWSEAAFELEKLQKECLSAALVAESTDTQASLLRQIDGVGDMLALSLLHEGKPSAALEAVAKSRGILLQIAAAMSIIDNSPSAITDWRTALLNWRSACSAQAEIQSQIEASLRRGVSIADELRSQLKSAKASTIRAHENLEALIREHGMDGAGFPSPEEIAASIPDGGVIAIPIVTSEGGAIVLQRHGQIELHGDSVIWLESLTSESVREILSGDGNGENHNDGWIGAYNRFGEAAYELQAASPEVAAEWNSYIEHTCDKLWESLIGPLDQWLRDSGFQPATESDDGSEVVILAPGRLGVVPLHAARRPVPSGGWRYSLEDWTYSYVPNLQALVACHCRSQKLPGAPSGLFAVTDPNGDIVSAHGFGDNPAWSAFKGRPRLSADGAAATAGRVLEHLRQKSGEPVLECLSFFCHGSWDFENPENSALVLAEGSRLTVADLRKARLTSTRLVILAACETGLVDVNRLPNEGLGLPGGLMEAGATAVVSSLWMVATDATHNLIRRFAELQLSGLSPAKALRRAQIETLRGSSCSAQIDKTNVTSTATSSLRAAHDTAHEWPDYTQPASPINHPTLGGFGFYTSENELDSSGQHHIRNSAISGSHPFFWAAFTMTGR